MNAKLGRESRYRPVIGKDSLHEVTNDNGSRLNNFTTPSTLIISSTYFPRKDIYNHTSYSPDGRIKNQIDHILIDKSNIKNARSYRGAEKEPYISHC